MVLNIVFSTISYTPCTWLTFLKLWPVCIRVFSGTVLSKYSLPFASASHSFTGLSYDTKRYDNIINYLLPIFLTPITITIWVLGDRSKFFKKLFFSRGPYRLITNSQARYLHWILTECCQFAGMVNNTII